MNTVPQFPDDSQAVLPVNDNVNIAASDNPSAKNNESNNPPPIDSAVTATPESSSPSQQSCEMSLVSRSEDEDDALLPRQLATVGSFSATEGRQTISNEPTWSQTRRGSPCPICGREGWCSVSTDGRFVNCKRETTHPVYGNGKQKRDKNGEDYCVFTLERNVASNEFIHARLSHETNGDCASLEVLHEVYSALLQQLPLSANHREALRRRGLNKPDQWIINRGYRTLPMKGRAEAVQGLLRSGFEESKLSGVPGVIVKSNQTNDKYWTIAGPCGLIIPVWSRHNDQSLIVAMMVRRDDDTGAKYSYLTSNGKDFKTKKPRNGASPGSPIHVPPALIKDCSVIRITEGVLKADIATFLTRMLTIGLPGVGAWQRGVEAALSLGATTVRVAYDADARTNWRVALHLQALVSYLRRKGIPVQLEVWDPAEGKGIDDVLVAGGKSIQILTEPSAVDRELGVIVEAASKKKLSSSMLWEFGTNASESVSASASATPPAFAPASSSAEYPDDPGNSAADHYDPPLTPTRRNLSPPSATKSGSGLPEIVANERQLRDITADAMQAVIAANSPPFIFQHGKVLSRLKIDQDTSRPILEVLTEDSMCGILARTANWYKRRTSKTKESLHDAPPPREVVRDVLALPDWPVPVLVGVTEAPVFAPSGELAVADGYHPAARIWHHASPTVTISDVSKSPTAQEVADAVRLLTVELMGQFPFADEASLAHALTALLLPFARLLIDGPTPLHLISAPVEGTGKTLLSYCIAIPATGREAEPMTVDVDEPEMRKRITSLMAEAPMLVLLDNLGQRLDSSSLASVLTARVWKDRLLGISKTATFPVTCTWLATGNNPTLSRELARRTIPICLDAKEENPYLRSGFKHANLAQWAKENRSSLIHAALMLIQAWIAAGKPLGTESLGMFEGWASTMGGILKVAGVSGFMTNLKAFRKTATDQNSEWVSFVIAWWDNFNATVVRVEQLAGMVEGSNLLEAVVDAPSDRGRRTRLGKALKKMAGRIVAGHRMVVGDEDHSGRASYRLERVGDHGGRALELPGSNGVVDLDGDGSMLADGPGLRFAQQEIEWLSEGPQTSPQT